MEPVVIDGVGKNKACWFPFKKAYDRRKVKPGYEVDMDGNSLVDYLNPDDALPAEAPAANELVLGAYPSPSQLLELPATLQQHADARSLVSEEDLPQYVSENPHLASINTNCASSHFWVDEMVEGGSLACVEEFIPQQSRCVSGGSSNPSDGIRKDSFVPGFHEEHSILEDGTVCSESTISKSRVEIELDLDHASNSKNSKGDEIPMSQGPHTSHGSRALPHGNKTRAEMTTLSNAASNLDSGQETLETSQSITENSLSTPSRSGGNDTSPRRKAGHEKRQPIVKRVLCRSLSRAGRNGKKTRSRGKSRDKRTSHLILPTMDPPLVFKDQKEPPIKKRFAERNFALDPPTCQVPQDFFNSKSCSKPDIRNVVPTVPDPHFFVEVEATPKQLKEVRDLAEIEAEEVAQVETLAADMELARSASLVDEDSAFMDQECTTEVLNRFSPSRQDIGSNRNPLKEKTIRTSITRGPFEPKSSRSELIDTQALQPKESPDSQPSRVPTNQSNKERHLKPGSMSRRRAHSQDSRGMSPSDRIRSRAAMSADDQHDKRDRHHDLTDFSRSNEKENNLGRSRMKQTKRSGDSRKTRVGMEDFEMTHGINKTMTKNMHRRLDEKQEVYPDVIGFDFDEIESANSMKRTVSRKISNQLHSQGQVNSRKMSLSSTENVSAEAMSSFYGSATDPRNLEHPRQNYDSIAARRRSRSKSSGDISTNELAAEADERFLGDTETEIGFDQKYARELALARFPSFSTEDWRPKTVKNQRVGRATGRGRSENMRDKSFDKDEGQLYPDFGVERVGFESWAKESLNEAAHNGFADSDHRGIIRGNSRPKSGEIIRSPRSPRRSGELFSSWVDEDDNIGGYGTSSTSPAHSSSKRPVSSSQGRVHSARRRSTLSDRKTEPFRSWVDDNEDDDSGLNTEAFQKLSMDNDDDSVFDGLGDRVSATSRGRLEDMFPSEMEISRVTSIEDDSGSRDSEHSADPSRYTSYTAGEQSKYSQFSRGELSKYSRYSSRFGRKYTDVHSIVNEPFNCMDRWLD